MRFYRPPALLSKLFSELVWRIPTGAKSIVYLTFDDGPMPGPTDFVLDQLEKVNARATFFCIGDNVRKHPETFHKVLSSGHGIGNHTYHHISGWSCSGAEYRADILKCEEVLQSSNPSKLFRPPFGKLHFSYKNYLPGMQVIMWDLLTYDYDSTLPVDVALKKICELTRPGSIVVFHDSLKAEKNLRLLLPPYLEFLKINGYELRSLHGSF